MNESEFNDIADQTIEDIQTAIDDSGADIDYDDIGGVLSLEFDNGSKIIFSKQAPARQLWMAAKSGGFHFDFDTDAEHWVCDDGSREEMYAMLSRLASEQAGDEISLSAP